MPEISERIKIARKKIGMSQLDLASRLGVSRPAVSKWEKDGSPESFRVEELAEVLGVDPAWLSGFGPREPMRKSFPAVSSESALMGAALLDWSVALRVACLLINCRESASLVDHERAEVMKRLYVLGVKDPEKLTEALVSAFVMSAGQ